MVTVTFQFEVEDERVESLLRLVGVAAPSEPGRTERRPRRETRRRPLKFHEDTPEFEGNFARLYKRELRPALWEMIYRAASAFGNEPFTLEQLAEALSVEPEEVRKRMRALGRSRIVSQIYERLELQGLDGTSREDAMPWFRYSEADGRWVYRFLGWQNPDESVSRYVLAEGLD
jgi:hypothetical protein